MIGCFLEVTFPDPRTGQGMRREIREESLSLVWIVPRPLVLDHFYLPIEDAPARRRIGRAS